MKKLIIVSAVAVAVAAGVLGSTVAQADTAAILDNWQERAYAQVKVGTADLGLSDNAMTLTGVAGLETPSIHPMLSFEADLTMTLTDAETSRSFSAGSVVRSATIEGSAFSMGGYAVASFDQLPIENLTPFVRLGLAYTSIDYSYSYNGTGAGSGFGVDGEDSEFGLAFSGGVRYAFNDRFSAVADYTNVSDLDILNLGVQYNF